ncbi:hypothetical protein F441_10744 [Phytophthora nicotianae CJ01A1]|uniref:Uncharacterized protein n=2 Tax=Phytophthora nicotianae TaxID=4792 RepID=W2GNF2_PHYNI|nr:hypothetical protein L915_10561 [Phytophthora nicotianae]ETL37933.1 hypothetical protein L916_10451 [Phytophthora nicotianae]ETP14333.1 hypothetical protein F441_10744 [Phytophthora nicotianae CJ01A1]
MLPLANGGVREANGNVADSAQGQQQAEGAVVAARELRSHDLVRLDALLSDWRDVDRKNIAGVPMWISDQMNPLKGSTLVVDLNLCHEAVGHAYNELKTFGLLVNSKTNVY